MALLFSPSMVPLQDKVQMLCPLSHQGLGNLFNLISQHSPLGPPPKLSCLQFPRNTWALCSYALAPAFSAYSFSHSSRHSSCTASSKKSSGLSLSSLSGLPQPWCFPFYSIDHSLHVSPLPQEQRLASIYLCLHTFSPEPGADVISSLGVVGGSR